MAQTVKHLTTMQETQFQSLGQEDPLGKEMATHSSILAWKIPWKEDPGVSPPNDTIVMSCVLNPYNCHNLHHMVLEYLCVKDS